MVTEIGAVLVDAEVAGGACAELGNAALLLRAAGSVMGCSGSAASAAAFANLTCTRKLADLLLASPLAHSCLTDADRTHDDRLALSILSG